MSRKLLQPKTIKSIWLTLGRGAEAFGLDASRFELLVKRGGSDSVEITLTYHYEDGIGQFVQKGEFSAVGATETVIAKQSRIVADQFVWNVALDVRCEHSAAPVGWSTHPAVASLITHGGAVLPNPANPMNWMMHGAGAIHMTPGGNVANATFFGREGVLLLDQATLVSNGGAVVASMRMAGPKVIVSVPGVFPDTMIAALVGRPASSVCEVFRAVPAGQGATISAARQIEGDIPSLEVTLRDRLVPLLPYVAGDENWRPRSARWITSLDNASKKECLNRYKSFFPEPTILDYAIPSLLPLPQIVDI